MKVAKIAGVIIAAGSIFFGAMVANAASGKCTVVEADGDKFVIECSQQSGKIQVGDTIKIKSSKKKAAIEGC